MNKLQASSILKKDFKLSTVKLSEVDIKKQVDQTKEMQSAVLKLKDVDQERLKVVVQL